MSSRNARRDKTITSMEQIMIDLKPRRSDSFVYCEREFDMTKLVDYINNKKKKNEDVTFFHAFVQAVGITIYNRPKLNRFVQNRHVFMHNDVVVSFVAKVSFTDKSEELMLMVPIEENTTIDDVSKYIKEKVESIRNKKGVSKEGANDAIDTLAKFPNPIRIPLIGLLKWCDDKGILPSSLVKDNLYYSSSIVSNLGSIKSNCIHHNLTNFGTASSLATMGEIKDTEVLIDGKKEIRKICKWGIAFDERVADGFYLIKSMELLQYIFDNPKLLDEPANQKIEIQKK